jgi:mono/diheme cytochrome c family protein
VLYDGKALSDFMMRLRKLSMRLSCHFGINLDASSLFKHGLCLCALIAILLSASACDVERRKSNAELGLNSQQIAGRKVYDDYCDRCHEPYSTRGKKGPGLKGVFKKQYLPMSGMPANDDRVTDIVRFGREKMPGFAQALTQDQITDLLAYLHTL